MKKLAVIGLLLGSTISFGQEKVKLRLNLNKGEKYQTHMKINQVTEPTIMEMEMKMEMLVEAKKSINYEVKNNFTYLSALNKHGAIKINYNSNMKEEELTPQDKKFADKMKPILETSIYLNMDRLGKSELIKLVPDVPEVTQLKDQISSVTYPEDAVGIGSTWVNVQKSNGADMELTYKVTKIEKDFVFADITGKSSVLTGAIITGKLKIDRKSGLPSTMTMNIDVSMMGVNMKTKSDISIKKI
ncbi:hypothetical protein BTO06_05610 [Tenacibaculum sp. SZ-18]|uniref:hypothetical protein n=1 Tax=Tenacibaculum sp. SZ-18 TaxID=754423 RepID=UPI000C2D3096|nr:hypothetical protein [Tenacibaculum sp. SZ-18]AUC14647.1 hypothetical protein BTO06_05610 [Tenacibaculum sp. SZ-18]